MPESIKSTLRALFFERYAQFRKHLHKRLGSEDLANDALHETYLRVENITVQGAIRFPAAYLFRIALNIAEDRRKSDSRFLGVAEIDELYEFADELAGERADDLTDPLRALAARSELAALELALAELPRRRRAIILASRVDETPHREIAQRFGISTRTVEKELRAGLEHCCARLGRDFIQRFGPGAGKQSKPYE